jgi:hypothetical protein
MPNIEKLGFDEMKRAASGRRYGSFLKRFLKIIP